MLRCMGYEVEKAAISTLRLITEGIYLLQAFRRLGIYIYSRTRL
jgi:hypothetical protein